MSTVTELPRLSSDAVLKVARLDAEKVYRDLSRYTIRLTEESDGWHVFPPKASEFYSSDALQKLRTKKATLFGT